MLPVGNLCILCLCLSLLTTLLGKKALTYDDLNEIKIKRSAYSPPPPPPPDQPPIVNLAGLISPAYTAAPLLCSTFAAKCLLNPGSQLTLSSSTGGPASSANEINFNFIRRPAGASLYLYLARDTGEDVFVAFPATYGELQVFVKSASEPKTTSSRPVNTIAGNVVKIDKSLCPAGKQCNILVKVVDSSGYSARFTVHSFSVSAPLLLTPGIPVPVSFHGDQPEVLFLYAANGHLNSSSTRFSLSPLSSSLINSISVNVAYVSEGGASLLHRSTTNSSFTSVRIQRPLVADKPISIKVKAVQSAPHALFCSAIVSIAPADTAGDVHLLSGLPFFGKVRPKECSFFRVTIPKVSMGVMGYSLDIYLETIVGDADLFANPRKDGFYQHGQGEQLSVFSSLRTDSHDRISIDIGAKYDALSECILSQDSDPAIPDCDILVTVYGYGDGEAEFVLRSELVGTPIVLTEGFQYRGVVSAKSYRYFAFLDSDTSRSVLFDVKPTSGDSDLYISCMHHLTGTDQGMPSHLWGHWNVSSQDFLEDAVEIAPTDRLRSCKPSKKLFQSNVGVVYYIAVYGFYESEFTLVARWKGGAQVLLPGVSVQGSVLRGLDATYMLYLGSVPQELRVVLIPLSDGDPDLFLTLNGNRAPQAKESIYASYEYRSSKTGREPDEIVVPESEVCTNCVVGIMVHGYNSAQFTVLATLADTSVGLVLGSPQRGSARVGIPVKGQMYSFRATASGRYTVELTVLSGNPILLASLAHKEPSLQDKAGETLRSDSNNVVYVDVNVPSSSNSTSGVSVFLCVHPSMGFNASYTIRASPLLLHQEGAFFDVAESLLLRLVQDLPQSDVIDTRTANPDAASFRGWLDWKYYSIVLPAGNEDLLLRSTALSGNLDLFVCRQEGSTTCFPNTTHSMANTIDEAYDNLRIHRKDAFPTRYVVGIHTSSDSSFVVYSISYSLDKASRLVLQDGIPVLDHVDEGEIDYYSFMVRSHELDTSIRITVTPLIGDPDVYVSTVHTRPGPANYTWKSIEYGSDILDIFTSSKRVDASNITNNDDTNSNEGYDGGESCSGCAYYIAVDGVRESTYTITATLSSTLPRLISGSPQSGRVDAGAWSYFLFSASFSLADDLHVTLTNRLGDADLYANVAAETSTNLNRRSLALHAQKVDESHTRFVESSVESVDKPTLFHYDYRSTERGLNADELTIGHSDAIAKSCMSLHVPCLVTIGVYGTQASDFSIVASSVSSAILVQQDRPVSGVVPVSTSGGVDKRQYYRVLLSGSQTSDSNNASSIGRSPVPIQFTFTLYSGSIDVALSCRTKRPNSSSSDLYYVVESITSAGSSSLNSSYSFSIPSITLIDSGCGSGSQLFFSVANRTETRANYVLVASEAAQEMIALEAGVTLFADVPVKEFDYYYFRPGASFEDVLLSVTPITGDVDVFVSRSWDKRPRLDKGGKVVSYSTSSSKMGSESLVLSHDWVADQCDRRPQCYLVVAVLGVFDTNSDAAGQGSRYMVTSSMTDSPTLLLDGVPARGRVDKGRYEYYKYPVTQLDADVVISASVYSGDVDLFVTLDSQPHPTRMNYSWTSGYIGSDAITIQSSDLAQKCGKKVAINAPCFLHVAAFGFVNSSYSLLANPDVGFASPILLTEHETQQRQVKLGFYTYFAFIVPPIDHSKLAGSIRITLTCLSGDGDLFVSLSTTKTGEPGRYKFDYKSSNFGSIVDEIDIRLANPTGPFCVDCTIYVAVYGYADSNYVLSATMRGLETLLSGVATGGHVAYESMRYYSFSNSDPSAKIALSLTSIQGDADLYVTTLSHSSDKANIIFPSPNHYTWHSLQTGGDAVRINYNDPNFCYDCIYIIGVYGYQNCTYSLLAVEAESTAIHLSVDRATSFQIAAGERRHFIVSPSDDVNDLVLSATTMDRGNVELYVRAQNISLAKIGADDDVHITGDSIRGFPDPSVSSSYDTSTRSTGRDTLTLHPFAPLHGQTKTTSSPIVYLITVLAGSGGVSGTLLASTSARHILLMAGTPQNHFVEEGHTAFFSFYPSSDPLDSLGSSNVRVSVVPSSGDPDLLISANPKFPRPRCISSTATPDSLSVVCTNYTWMSRMYNADQIAINGDYPCESVLSSTTTAPSCAEDVAHGLATSNAPLYIGVFGYRSTSFTITITTGLNHQYLLAGQPQPAVLSTGHSCRLRSFKSGMCMDAATDTDQNKIDVAYFAFKVSTKGEKLLGEIIVTVVPHCNVSGADGRSVPSLPCPAGCACNPLQVIVKSCVLSRCNSQDAMPSLFDKFGTSASMRISSTEGSSLFIDPSSPVHCDPSVQKETCAYFVAVVSSTFTGEAAAFTITTRTPGDVMLIPCKQNPDGINYYHTEDFVSSPYSSSSSTSSSSSLSSNVLFEICANKYSTADPTSSMRVTAERCFGPPKLSLFACGAADGCIDVVPSPTSWKYYSDGQRSCVAADPASGRSNSASCRNGLGVPDLSLPYSSSGNYFLSMQSGGGRSRFQLSVRTQLGGKLLPTPLLVHHLTKGKKTLDEVDLKVKVSVDGSNANFEWAALAVEFPGISYTILGTDSNPVYVASSEIAYSLLVAPVLEANILTSEDQVSLHSSCGIEYATSVLMSTNDASKKGVFSLSTYSHALEEETGIFKRKVSGLLPHTDYVAFLVATCDSNCLQILGKRHHDLALGVDCCGEKGDVCKPQSLLYQSAAFSTGARSSSGSSDTTVDDPSGGSASGSGWSLVATLLYVVLGFSVIGGILLLWYYWKLGGLEHISSGFSRLGQSEMVNIDTSSHGSSSSSSSHGLTSEGWSKPSGQTNSSYEAPQLGLGNVSRIWNSAKEKMFGGSDDKDIHTNRPKLNSYSSGGGSSGSWASSLSQSPMHTGGNPRLNPNSNPNSNSFSHASRKDLNFAGEK